MLGLSRKTYYLNYGSERTIDSLDFDCNLCMVGDYNSLGFCIKCSYFIARSKYSVKAYI